MEDAYDLNPLVVGRNLTKGVIGARVCVRLCVWGVGCGVWGAGCGVSTRVLYTDLG